MGIPTADDFTRHSLSHPTLEGLVAELADPVKGVIARRADTCKPLPSRQAIIEIVEMLRSVFFPRCYGPEHLDEDALVYHLGSTIDLLSHRLYEQIYRGLCFACSGDKAERGVCAKRAEDVVTRFLASLPDVARLLKSDIAATYEGDPAATGEDEIVVAYPGITAMLCHRIAHEIYKLDVKIIARIISEYAHSLTGIDIHPGAAIGASFMIDHGTGVVIGETTRIGHHVRLYQGVTLGAKTFPTDADGALIRGARRHPTLGDNIVVYAGATILGTIEIGSDSVIGGNVWLTESVPSGSRVLQNRATRERFEHGAGI